MRRMQIEIYSNLEAYVCLSYDAMTTKAIFQMKRKHFSSTFSENPFLTA